MSSSPSLRRIPLGFRAIPGFLGAMLGAAAVHAASAGPMPSFGGENRPVGLLTAAFAVLLFLSGLTSGSETAIFSLDKLDVMQIRKRGGRFGRAIRYVLARQHDSLTALLVFNNAVNITLSMCAGAITEAYFRGASAGGLAVAAFASTSLLLIFGEVVPKCVSHTLARRVAPVAAWPTAALVVLLAPVRWGINAFLRFIFRIFNIVEQGRTDWVSEEELKAVISTGEVSTLLEEDERDMIEGVFDLRHTLAEEIMIPRPDVKALPDSLGQEEMLARLRELRHSRVLVYHESLDHPSGFLLVKEVLLEPDKDWRSKLRPPVCLPAKIRLHDLLRAFRRDRVKFVVLVDEFGGVAGIATLNNLLEEIVGDMAERHEHVQAEVQAEGPGRWRAAGHANLADLAAELRVVFPEDVGLTAGGFVMNTLGRVPVPGDSVEHEGLRFTVSKMLGRRILQIEIERPGAAPAGTGGGAS